ncbi:Spy0128 family protein [Paratractidigestivibacter faecalis]|uniref:Spy0128 family protein n=1 Tax=Paratractidigestivibacter faecalis TaxID=2292441 RepID=UPI003AF86B12
MTSTSQFYGAFSAEFLTGKAPKPGDNVAVYEFPGTIVVDNNAGGDFMAGSGTDAKKAGTWKIEDNKVIFTFDEGWLKLNPAGIYVAANFSFQLTNKDTGSGGGTSVVFPGAGSIDIHTKDGKVTGTKEGAFSQGADGVAKVTWTVKLTVESYATNVKFTDVLGDNFSFVDGSFMLDGKKLEPQPTITGQNATLDSLGNLSQGDHTITYETVLKGDVSVNNGDFINDQEASKNTASWEWGGANDRQNGTVTAAPSKFRYDMINKSNGSGTPSDISWTVKLNQGELKADMRGYVFTDTLDEKQTYTGSYTVYKGDSGSEVIETGVLGSTQSSFTYTFPSDLADRYATYCIVYHTKMKDASSYATVRNSAVINRKGSVSGTDDGAFTPQLVGTPITKNLLSSEDAATTGRATWKTQVALKAIVNAVNPDKVTVKDTFQSAWSQNLGVDEGSITIKIGETVLVRDADWCLTGNRPVSGTQRNFNLDIIVNDRVKAALENEDYAVITYTTTSDALPGWYSNFASVSALGLNLQRQYTDLVMYVVNQETTPAVEKPEAESKVSWDEDFDWNAVDGSAEKGAWVVDWTVYANRQKGNKGSDDKFEYFGAGKLNGEPLNIIDTLPDGMSYVEDSARYTLVQNPYGLHTGYGRGSEAKTVVSDRQLAASGVSNDNNTVTFSIPTAELGGYAGYAKLTYKTAVKRSKLNTSTNEVKFTNSASAESENKKFDSGSGTVTVKNNVIQKTSEQLGNSNRIKYTILVNESAVDLMATSDFLELVDTMDAKCTLVPSSLKAYERSNGQWAELTKDKYSSKMEQVEGAAGTQTRLTLTVPDGKYLKVEYEVIPSGNPGDEVSLSNTAKLTGVTEGSATDEKTWTVKDAAASAGGNGYGITMTKYDAQQVGATLEGAEFKLYRVNMNRAATDAIENSRELFETAKTNANGKISFGTSEKAMSNCELYQLVETRAPDGYAEAEPTWIMLKGNAEDDVYQAALTKAKTIVGGAKIIDDTKKNEIWVYDNRMTGTAVIKAKKVLEGGTFKNGQFSFALKDADGKVLQTVTNDAEGNVSFNVDYNKAGEYRYTISELVPEGAENNVKDHITYDTTVHDVIVTVKNGDGKLDAAVTYDDGPSTPPTFTNKYSTTLPAAGGSGTAATYLAGAALLAIAAARMHLHRTGAKKGGESRE